MKNSDDEKLRHTECVGKAKHLTYADATRQKKKGKSTSKGMPKKFKIDAYKCQFCGFYHVGNSKV